MIQFWNQHINLAICVITTIHVVKTLINVLYAWWLCNQDIVYMLLLCLILNITLDACQSFNQVISSFYTLVSLYDRHCLTGLGQYIWDASNTYMARSIYKICIEYMHMLVYMLCIEFICLGQLVQFCNEFLKQKLIMNILNLNH